MKPPDAGTPRTAEPPGATPATPPLAPGDEAAPGTPGTGEAPCRRCNGSGRVGGARCPECGGSGTVTVGIGGA